MTKLKFHIILTKSMSWWVLGRIGRHTSVLKISSQWAGKVIFHFDIFIETFKFGFKQECKP